MRRKGRRKMTTEVFGGIRRDECEKISMQNKRKQNKKEKSREVK